MARSLVALGTVAVLGTVTLTTPNPAAAQPWLLPVAAGFLTGAFVGAAASPYYPPYYGYGYNGYGYNGYYNGCCGSYYPADYGGYAEPYYAGASTTVVIVNGNNGYNGYGYNGYSCHHHCWPHPHY